MNILTQRTTETHSQRTIQDCKENRQKSEEQKNIKDGENGKGMQDKPEIVFIK